MNLNEKIAARRREREKNSSSLSQPQKTKENITSTPKEVDHAYEAQLYQIAINTLKDQLKSSPHKHYLKKEIESLQWNIELKQKAYPEYFSDTKKIKASKELLSSPKGERDLKNLLEKIESKSNSADPIAGLLGLIPLAGLIYITYLLIFDPDFAWWEFLLWLFGIVFFINLFIPNHEAKTSK